MKRYAKHIGYRRIGMRFIPACCLLLTLSIPTMTTAQVGIGNAAPDTASVLDLTNPGNKGLVLPPSSSSASFSSAPITGMVYLSGDHIHYKRSDGYNALSPWKYRFAGDSTDHVYYNSGGRVGIGNANLSVSPDAPLQIETDVPVSLSSHGSVMIGESTGKNLIMNSGEIQVRDNGIGAPLLFNEDGGDIDIGAPGSPTDLDVTGRVLHYDQPTGNYYDYLPLGTVTFWYGSVANIPQGWAVCDGNSYMASDNSGMVTTPDLQGMFLLSQGSNGTSAYTTHDVGGEDLVTLTAAQNPPHDHYLSLTTGTGGNHRHSMGGSYSEHDGNGNGGEEGLEDHGSRDTGSTGNHSHSVSGNTQPTGGTPHENRPVFHALVYIMKL